MTYYVWKTDFRQSNQFAYFEDEPDGYEVTEWTAGAPMGRRGAALKLVGNLDKALPLSDVLLVTGNIQIHSPKLVKIFKALDITNVEYFPVSIELNGKPVGADYLMANFIGRITCVDIDNSEVEYFPEDHSIKSVEEFEILEEKIVPLPGMKSPPKLFRLGETQFVVLAHESLKAACEREKITGIRFIKTQEFG